MALRARPRLHGRLPVVSSMAKAAVFLGTHLNLQPGSLASACDESPLEAAPLLLPASHPRFPGLCWVPAAVRSTAGYKASTGAVSSSRAEVAEAALLGKPEVSVSVLPSGMGLGHGLSGVPVAKRMDHSQHWRLLRPLYVA
jgi:hypothetical protein